ncbi:MAG: hypothetical protein MGAcid_14100 [uncultured Acidilobus sp. MG]|nr:MAG: hypothetical protein MGAcid_14100 [uncultured Acidilobus sp. MG]
MDAAGRLRLAWFVVRTRLSRGLVALTLVMVAYGLVSAAYLYTGRVTLPPADVRAYRVMAIVYSAVLLFLSSMQGGMAVLKSDRDYLFTLPVSRSELAFSLYVGQLMLGGLLTVAWLGWYLPFVEVPPGYAAFDLVLFVLLLTSLSASVAELPAKRRALAASGIALWAASGVWNPVSPSSFFSAHFLAGTLTLAALSVGLTSYTLRRLGRAPLIVGSQASQPSPSEGPALSFQGARGPAALLRMKLNSITLSGRVGGFSAGGSRYFSRRVSLLKFMGYMAAASLSLLAAALALYALGLLPTGYQAVRDARSGGATALWLLYMPAVIAEVLFIGFSSSDVINERPWLAFTSLSPGKYLRLSALSWALVTLASLAPFSIAYLVIWLLGVWPAIGLLPQLLITTPTLSVLAYFASASLVMMPQLRYEGFTPGQAGIRGLVLAIIVMVPVIMLSYSLNSFSFSLYSSLVALAIISPLLALDGPWASASRKLVEKGYV